MHAKKGGKLTKITPKLQNTKKSKTLDGFFTFLAQSFPILVCPKSVFQLLILKGGCTRFEVEHIPCNLLLYKEKVKNFWISEFWHLFYVGYLKVSNIKRKIIPNSSYTYTTMQ